MLVRQTARIGVWASLSVRTSLNGSLTGVGVDPFPWTVHGYFGSGQLMVFPFVFDRRDIAQRRMAA